MATNINFDTRSLKAKNLLEKFKDYTKEEIFDAISRLRQDQRELVYEAYGPNLDNPLLRIYLPIEDRRRVDSIVHNTLFRYLNYPEKKARVIKTVFDYFPNNTKEEVLEAFSRLTQSTQYRIKQVYGESLEEVENRKNIDVAELKRVHELIDHTLRKKVEEKRAPRALNIFEYFADYSKERVLEAFYTLSPTQQELLKRAYGDNLDDASKRLELTPKERARANDIIRSTFSNRVSPNMQKRREVKNLFERFRSYSKEEILEAFTRLLPEQQTLLKKAYGDNLESHSLYSELTEPEKKRVNGIISHELTTRLLKKQTISPQIKTIFELYDNYSEEEVLDAISRLKEEDIILLQKGFGKDYKELSLRHQLSKEERMKLNGIIHSSLIRRLQNTSLQGQIVSTVFKTYPSFSEEEIMTAVNKLNQNQQTLLKKAFGEDLKDSKKLSELTAKERQNVKKIINVSLNSKLNPKRAKRKVKNIYERFPDYSEEEIKEAISRLDEESRQLLYKAYGKDLTSKELYGSLSDKEKEKIKNIVQTSIRSRLYNKNLQEKEHMSKYSNLRKAYAKYTWEDVLTAISKLSSEEQELLKKYYGEDYSKECNYRNIPEIEKEKLNLLLKHKIINRLRLKKAHNLRIKTVIEYFDNKYTKEEILKAFNLLSIKDQEALIAAYGKELDSLEVYMTYTPKEKQKVRKIITERLSRILDNGIKPYNTIPNVFERLKDYTKEEIWDAFHRLPNDKQELLISVFGKDLIDVSHYKELSKEEKHTISTIIHKDLLNRIKNPTLSKEHSGRLVKNFIERYPDKSFMELMDVFQKLKPEKQQILIKAYGENLDKKDRYTTLSNAEKELCHLALMDFRIRMKSETNKKTHTNMNLFEHFPYSTEDEVLYIVNTLTAPEQDLLTRAYGKDYKETELFQYLSKHEKTTMNNLIIKLRNKLKELSLKESSLYANDIVYEDISREREKKYLKRVRLSYYYELKQDEKKVALTDYFEVVPRLKRMYQEANKQRKEELLIEAINNSTLWRDQFLEKKEYLLRQMSHFFRNELSEEQAMNIGYTGLETALRYYDISNPTSFDEYAVPYIEREIRTFIQIKEKEQTSTQTKQSSNQNKYHGQTPKNIFEFFPDIQKEQVLNVIDLLPEDNKQLLKMAYGDNYDDVSNFKDLAPHLKTKVYRLRLLMKDYFEGNIPITKLQKGKKQNQVGRTVQSLLELFSEYDKTKLYEALDLLVVSERELLQKAYGEDYNSADKYCLLPENEKNKVIRIRKKLTEHLTGKKIIKKRKTSRKNNYHGKRAETLKEYLKEYSYEEIKEALKILTEEDQKLLLIGYGEDFDTLDNFHTLTKVQKNRLLYSRRKLLSYLKGDKKDIQKNNGYKAPSLREHFSNYSKEELEYVVSLLKDNEQELLIRAYGEDLSSSTGYLTLPDNERQRIYKIRKKITAFFEGKINKEELLDRQQNSNAKSLLLHFKSYSKEQLLDYISVLPQDSRELLIKAYGENYDTSEGYSTLSDEDKRKVGAIRQNLKMFFARDYTTEEVRMRTNSPTSITKGNKSLKEFFHEYPLALIQKEVSLLLPAEKELVLKVYGEDLAKKNGFYELTKQEKQKVLFIRQKLKRHLEKNSSRNIQKISLRKYLGDISFEDINELVAILPPKDQELLIKVYGEDFNSFNGYNNITRYEMKKIYSLRNKIKKVVEKEEDREILIKSKKGPKVKTIIDHLSKYDIDKVIEAINQLPESDILLLQKAYGPDYQDSDNYRELTEQEKKTVEYIRYKLRDKLAGKTKEKLRPSTPAKLGKRAKSLKEYFRDYDEEVLMTSINSLSTLEKTILQKAYGPNYDEVNGYYTLSQKEKTKVAVIRNKLKESLEHNKPISKKVSPRTERAKKDSFTPNESLEGTNLGNLAYKRLSRKEEIIFVKKAKLSYFDDVDEETQRKYLTYYFEVFPIRHKRYQSIISEIELIKNKINIASTTNNLEELKELSTSLKKLNNKREKLLRSYIIDSKYYRDKFLENNQRLVISIAKKWQFSFNSLNDLIMEGNLGMMKALEKFDVEKGNKFSTYATWWIKQSITRYISDTSNTIRIPVHQIEKMTKIRRVYDELSQQLYREPTTDEISLVVGIPAEEINFLYDKFNQINPTSLDQKVKSDSDTDLSELIGDDDSSFDNVENTIFLEQFYQFLDKAQLSDRELYVLNHRLGLSNNTVKTLDEIGREFNLSRERVRQIEQKALHKLTLLAKKSSFFEYSKDKPKTFIR